MVENRPILDLICHLILIVGVAVMFINLVVDLSYGLLDPRVRYR